MGRPQSPSWKRSDISNILHGAGLASLKSDAFPSNFKPCSNEVIEDLKMLSEVISFIERGALDWEIGGPIAGETEEQFQLRGKHLAAARLAAFTLTMGVTRRAMVNAGADMTGFYAIEAAIESAATGTGKAHKKLHAPRHSSSQWSPAMQSRRALVFAYVELHPDEIKQVCDYVAEKTGIPRARVKKAIENYQSVVMSDPHLKAEVAKFVSDLSVPPLADMSFSNLYGNLA